MRIHPRHTRNLHRHAWMTLVALVVAAWWGGSKPGFVFEKYTLMKSASNQNNEAQKYKVTSNMKKFMEERKKAHPGRGRGGEKKKKMKKHNK